jgi:hypothetical protein
MNEEEDMITETETHGFPERNSSRSFSYLVKLLLNSVY